MEEKTIEDQGTTLQVVLGRWAVESDGIHLRLTSLIFCPCQLEEGTASHQLQGFGCKTCSPLFH